MIREEIVIPTRILEPFPSSGNNKAEYSPSRDREDCPGPII
jgi:hypothetical protein